MPWWMGILLIIYVLACIFLIMVILLQSGSKGGGLSSLGSASSGIQDTLGATGAEKTLNKMTTVAAVLFMVLAIVLSLGGRYTMTRTQEIIGEPGPAAAPITGAAQTPGLDQPETGVAEEIMTEDVQEAVTPDLVPATEVDEAEPAEAVPAETAPEQPPQAQ